MVTTDASIKLTELQSSVRNLFYTRITWERYNNKKIIIQCHRCQQWGHATANCNRMQKCANNHFTRDCTKPTNTPAKCANYIECPHYKSKLEQRQRNMITNNQHLDSTPSSHHERTTNNHPGNRKQLPFP